LDRRETDFKVGELAVRQDDDPSSPPKSFDLLRHGEALFASGEYQQAIHVWTRILFLDRSNSEARVRIDRAKAAVAERQRKLDAQVADAIGLLEAGEIGRARESVRSVLATDASHGEARQLADAIEVLDRKAETSTPVPASPLPAREPAPASRGVILRVPKGARAASPRCRRKAAPRFKMAAFLLGALVSFAASAFLLRRNWDTIVSDGAFGRPPDAAKAVLPARPAAAVPDLSELRYYNGERLFAQGRYREALAELHRVDRGSRVASEARALVLRIEDRLLRDSAGDSVETR
jgi:tetratricopeptide (TPR) repeat protein